MNIDKLREEVRVASREQLERWFIELAEAFDTLNNFAREMLRRHGIEEELPPEPTLH